MKFDDSNKIANYKLHATISHKRKKYEQRSKSEIWEWEDFLETVYE